MQLCALDRDDQLVFALKAAKHRDYFCVECGKVVRLRSGMHRQPHYYHLQPNQACRQHAKGMTHLMVQHFFFSKLPAGDVKLEYRFPQIGRIADVVWLSKQLVFEIQCSPISAEELQARNAHYASIGYKVIWILHDNRYNKKRLTAAEDILQSWPHYFTNMDIEGNGIIYDQFKRNEKYPRFPVDVASPIDFQEKQLNLIEGTVPFPLFKRAKNWSMSFLGDSVDRYLNLQESSQLTEEEVQFFHEMQKVFSENSEPFLSLPIFEGIKLFALKYIAAPYRVLFRLFLERACK